MTTYYEEAPQPEKDRILETVNQVLAKDGLEIYRAELEYLLGIRNTLPPRNSSRTEQHGASQDG
jgi:hypothetical protein